MRHRKTNVTLDRTSAQRQRLLRNLVGALLEREAVVTTRARGQFVRAQAERLITIGKTSTLARRRQLLQALPQAKTVKKIIDQLGPRYQQRTGGYTRMVRLARRVGDGAEQVRVELLP